jgi:hypothetical protein
MEAENIPTYVIVDTNIFVYGTRLFTSSMGIAFLYAIRRANISFLLPEIIELELRKNTHKMMMDAINSISENYRLIEMVMGSRDDYKVPDEEKISARVDERLNEFGEIIKIPISFEHTKNALNRIMEEIPPNSPNNQQYKDSLIWEAILEVGKGANVHFITHDKAFYEKREPNKGSAKSLLLDADRLASDIQIHYEIEEFLEKIRDEIPPVNKSEISANILDEIKPYLQDRSEKIGYVIGEMVDAEISPFLTEKNDVLAVKFKLKINVKDVLIPNTNERTDGVEIIEGNCELNQQSTAIENLQFDRFTVHDLYGNDFPQYGHIYLRAGGIVLGRKTIPYQYRGDLPWYEEK